MPGPNLRVLQKPALFAAVFFLSLWLCDRALTLIGYPAPPVQSYTYPAHSKEVLQMVDHTFEYRSNDRGIRYRDLPLEKAPGEKRVVMIGDSFVEGEGVDLEQTFGALLEKKLSMPGRAVNFINCGISGTGPEEYIQVLSRVGLQYRPDRVLMVLYANDLAETARTVPASTLIGDERPLTRWKAAVYDIFPKLYLLCRRFYALHFSRFVPDVIRLTEYEARSRDIPEDKIKRWADSLPPDIVKLANDGWIDGNWLSAGLIYPEYWVENFDLTVGTNRSKWPLMALELDRIRELCRSNGLELAVAYAPHPYQYDPHYSPVFERAGLDVNKEWLTTETAFEKLIRGWTESRQVPFLNLTPVFQRAAQASEEPLNFRLDQHWNPAGHRLAASALYDWLTEKVWPDLKPSAREKILSMDAKGSLPKIS